MIPARDPAEFAHFPQADRDFIHGWLSWTDANLAALGNTLPLLAATLSWSWKPPFGGSWNPNGQGARQRALKEPRNES